MSRSESVKRDSALLDQLAWFVRLRWGAGLVAVTGALIDRLWLGWYPHSPGMLWVSVAILAYNALLYIRIRSLTGVSSGRAALGALAWTQILLDLVSLTLLTIWTGGVHSPLLGFYVFHMVIASLLLQHPAAYVGTAAAGLMLLPALWATDQLPTRRGDALLLLGWMVMLLTVAYLAGTITRNLTRHRLRVMRQQGRIRAMSDQLRRNEKAMAQQEKMGAIGVLAAGIAHEITNPLAGIDSLLQLIQRHPDRVRQDDLAKMKEQVHRINQIVRQLTSFAHAGEAPRQRVSVGRAVEETLRMAHFDRRMRNVDVHVDIPASPSYVRVQPHTIEHVLVNLILNAVDAMADEPQPRLSIRVSRQGGECVIEVSDNGCGIPAADMDRIFEPFFTSKPVGKGTGLGLAVSYGLIRSHGGRIKAESPGKGAKFTVSFPMDDTFS